MLALCVQGQQSITLLQPAAGVSWDGATTHTIKWVSQNINLIRIEFSANGGTSWQLIEAAYPATANSYGWTVPAQPTDSARIRLSDTDNPAINTVSGLFTIPEPYINLVQPANLTQGNAYSIRWQSSCIFHLDVLFSNDGGTTWDTIFENVDAPSGIKNWPLPEASQNCLLKLVDAASPEMFTVSEPFVIAETTLMNVAKYHGGSFDGYARSSNLAPQLEVVSPAGGEVWDGSTEQLLSWNANNTFRIMMLFSADGGNTWPDTLQTLYPAEASKYGITIPNTPTTAARFKLVSLDVPGLEAESGDFTIPEPFIEIQNEFQQIYSGTPYPIMWKSSGVSHVNIFYSADASATWDTIAMNVEATRDIKNWKVPEPTEEGIVRITDSTGTIFDETGTFTIVPLPVANPAKFRGGSFDGYARGSNIQPSLDFVNPLGGEIWDGSTVQTIKWESTNTFRLMILFSTDDGLSWPDTLMQLYPAEAAKLAFSVPNTPTEAARFKLISLDVEGLEAVSEAFTIPPLFVTITNTFANLYAGTPYTIFWESSGISLVNISYSSDGGTNWEPIAVNVPAVRGIKNWKVPAATTNGIIAVTDTALQHSDQTEVFAILDLPQHNPVKYQGGSYDGWAMSVFQVAEFGCPPDTAICLNAPAFEPLATPPGGTFTGTGMVAGAFDPTTAGVGTYEITYTYTYFNGSSTACTFFITVHPMPVVNCPAPIEVCIDAAPFVLSGATPANGIYTGAGVDAGIFDPALAGAGEHLIIYSYTSPDGCTGTCSLIITVHALPQMSCPNNIAVCIDQTPFALHSALPANGIYEGTGVSNGTFYPATAGAGSHEIIYAFTDENFCTNTCSFFITVNPLPEMSCPEDFEICVDAGITALPVAQPTGGTYSGPGVDGAQFNPVVAGIGTHTIAYVFTDENGCTNTCSFAVTVNALPDVSCPADVALCIDHDPVTLSGANPAGGNYQGLGVSNGIFTPALAGVGTHEIEYFFTDANGCSNVCTFTIVVNPLPVVICPEDMMVCVDSETIALSDALPDGGIYSGAGVSANSFDPQLAGVGDHEIVYSYTDANGCSASCNFTIHVKPLPVVSCPGNYAVCQNDAPFAITGASPAGGVYTGTGVVNGIFDPATTGTGIKNITYTFVDGFGCENSCSFKITVLPAPEVTCPANMEVCLDAAPFEIIGLSPAGGTLSGNGIDGTTFTPAQAGVGIHEIFYSYTSPINFCTSTCSFEITVHELPAVSCGADIEMCLDNGPLALDFAEPAGGIYSGNGVSGNVFDPAVAGAGEYLITYQFTSIYGCSSECTFLITVQLMPEMVCPETMGICIYEAPLTLDFASPEGGIYSGEGVASGKFYPELAGPGTHLIQYNYSDEFGCSGNCSFVIEVYPTPVITCNIPGEVCKYDGPIILDACTPSGGTYSGLGVAGNTFFPEIANIGNHEITYHYTDPETGCENESIINIRVKPSQLVEIPQGWMGISSFLTQQNSDIQEIFSDMQNQLIILYNLDGDVYFPGGNIYPFNPWNAYSGYCLKSAGMVDMHFCGEFLEELTVQLSKGWNLVPMLSKTPVSSDFVFGFNNDIKIVKQVAGSKLLWKEMGINTLGFVNPGKAYFVYCYAPTSISYPYYADKAAPETKPEEPILSPFATVTPTPISHVIAFDANAVAQLKPGDILAGFGQNGLCTGLAQISDEQTTLVLYGDDATTEQNDGLTDGEEIRYRLYRPEDDQTFDLLLSWDADYQEGNAFVAHGVSVATSIHLSSVGISVVDPGSISIYPNPTTGDVQISGIEDNYTVEVYNAVSENLLQMNLSGEGRINLSSYPKGIYIIKITTRDLSFTKKVVLQ